jgi:hypothetical protein
LSMPAGCTWTAAATPREKRQDCHDSGSLLDPFPAHLLHGRRPSQLELGCSIHTTLPSSTPSSMFLSLFVCPLM